MSPIWHTVAVATLVASSQVGFAHAQGAAEAAYPSKPVRLVVPVAPGGLTDILGRTLAARLQDRLGQTVIVENRGGAGGVVGTAAVVSAPADGYTLLMTFLGPAAVRQALGNQNVGYDTLRDFAPVGQVARFPMLLVVSPDLPAKNVAEFIALAKAKPGELTYASAGAGSTGHLVMELFQREAGLDVVHVPYKGEAPAMIDVMSGRVNALWMSLSVAQAQIKAGKLRALGIANKERHKGAPEIPAISETVKGFEFTGWYGILVPAATPKPIVQRLGAEFVAIVNDPSMAPEYDRHGIEPAAFGPDAFGQLIRTEIEKWRRIGASGGFKID
jgi:tripartite-type tricarboxylate transporter receptor subunit TctC